MPDEPTAIPATPTIRKAIVRAYNQATHKADVQIVGSHPTLLAAIRLATNIPAADVVPGRQATVAFLDPANPDEAVALAIQGALPSTVRGGQLSGGHLYLESTLHATKGEVQVVDGSPFGMRNIYGNYVGQMGGDPSYMLRIRNQSAAEPTSSNKGGLSIDPYWAPTADAKSFIALGGLAIVNSTGYATSALYGLNFIAALYGGSAVNVIGTLSTAQKLLSTSTIIQNMECVTALPSVGPNAVIQNLIGLRSRNAGNSGAAFSIGLKIDDVTAGTYKYLIEAGPLTPNLRVEAGTPTSGGADYEDSRALLAFRNAAGTVTLRRLHTRPFASITPAQLVVLAI